MREYYETGKIEKKLAVIVTILTIAIFVIGVGAGFCMQKNLDPVPLGSAMPSSKKEIERAEKEKKKALAEEKAAKDKKEKAERIKKMIKPLGPLKKKIRKEIRGKEGNWSIYVKNLTSNKSFSINNRATRAASIIKLYTAGAFLRAVKEGMMKMDPENAYDLEYMIKESSNTSWKALEARMASAYGSSPEGVVNGFIDSKGFRSTYRDRYSLHGSTTSVEDTGRVLAQIYRGRYVSKKGSARMLKYMKMQDHTAKIPAGLPKGTRVANKTGELDTVDNDAAIVFTKYQDYILVVMADETNMNFWAVPEIKKISKMVYRYIIGK